MLISRRREGDAIQIGEDVEIRIVSVRKKKVILGIIAPRDVKIVTTKLGDAELENTAAAANAIDLNELLHRSGDTDEQIVFLLESGSSGKDQETSDKSSGAPE